MRALDEAININHGHIVIRDELKDPIKTANRANSMIKALLVKRQPQASSSARDS